MSKVRHRDATPHAAKDAAFHRKAAMLSFGLTAALFYVLPLLIIWFARRGNASGILLLAISFVAPLLMSVLPFADWAGRNMSHRKAPSFIMGFSALTTACFVSVALMMATAPGDIRSFVTDGHHLVFGLATAAVMAAFGVPAAIVATLFFIGSCEKRTRESDRGPVGQASRP